MSSRTKIAGLTLNRIVGIATCGIAAGPTALLMVIINDMLRVLIGEAPGFDFDHPSNVKDAALMILASAKINTLYWLVAVRRDRNRRELAEQHGHSRDGIALRSPATRLLR